MFQRAVRLRQAEEALARGLWEEALRLASDPTVAEHRRAAQVRRKAREALLARARHRMEKGNLPGAWRDVKRAGGDATLGEALKAALGRADREKREQRERLEKARFFLRAGYPGKVLDLLEGVESYSAQTLRRLARDAVEEGSRKLEKARSLLEKGDTAGALGEWRAARRSNREIRAPGGILQAFPGFSHGVKAGADWERWVSFMEADPWLLEFREVREKWETSMDRALEAARRHLCLGETTRAGRILEGLERFPLGDGAFQKALELLAWKEGLELFRAGRPAEAAGLVREGCPSHPEALEFLEKGRDLEGLDRRAARTLSRFLGEGEAGPLPADLARDLRWAGAEPEEEVHALLESSKEALAEGFRLLEEGFPLRAFRAFLQARAGGKERDEGMGRALERMRKAREKLGAWRARLARFRGEGGSSALEGLLEEAARLDREAPGLEEAFSESRKARDFSSFLGEACEGTPLGEGVRRFCRSFSFPPGPALTLRRLGGLREESRRQRPMWVRAGEEEARMLGAARERWGLPPDPAFPAGSPRAGAPAAPAGPGAGNPLEGFFLRVAGRGDLLVLPRDRIVLGSAAGGKADLPVLAGIGAREAEFTRRLRFHEGVTFHVRSLSDRPLVLDGESLREGLLRDGSLLSLGRALEVRFLRPRKESSTALLEFPGDFEVEGCRKAAWMKAPGWDGALVLGPGEDSHLRIPGAGVRMEISLDGKGRIVIRSTENIEAGETSLGKEGILPGFGRVRSGDLLVFLDPRPPSPARSE